jgi:hypothetical protein
MAEIQPLGRTRRDDDIDAQSLELFFPAVQGQLIGED